MKYKLILVVFLLVLSVAVSAKQSDKTIQSGDCWNPPGYAKQACLDVRNIEGYGVCTFVFTSNEHRYNDNGVTLVGCK